MSPKARYADIRLVVVMGVSGAGKTTVGKALADKLDAPFIDADHLHPQSNVDKMRGGTPLEDADRWPWLRIVAKEMYETATRAGRAVCACSALRRVYRDCLTEAAGEDILFILLHGDKTLIARRQANRPGHFMPPRLLDSQFATLELFETDELGLVLDVSRPVDQLVAEAAGMLGA